jgi:glutathione synthase/RimK-type ligase-like ATP-grasp enzyme
MARIGLIGPSDRAELIRLAICLEERGADPVFLDPRKDPAITLDAEHVSACGNDLTDLRGCYVADLALRRPYVLDDAGVPEPEASLERLDASRRHLALWNAVLERLGRQGSVVNPPRTHDLHGLKPWEMAVYARRGLRHPATLSTCDPAALSEPPASSSGTWIRKGLVGGYGYTENFTPPADRAEAEAALGDGPLSVQERVSGDNVRAYVLDGRVLGAAVIVPARADDTDSRRDTQQVRRYDLPAAAVETAVTAASCWGMVFAAVDFMIDAASGEHLVLECNSAPFFVTFEQQTGLPITKELAGYLARQHNLSQLA